MIILRENKHVMYNLNSLKTNLKTVSHNWDEKKSLVLFTTYTNWDAIHNFFFFYLVKYYHLHQDELRWHCLYIHIKASCISLISPTCERKTNKRYSQIQWIYSQIKILVNFNGKKKSNRSNATWSSNLKILLKS